MTLNASTTSPGFSTSLRQWRRTRKMSQLDLALTADVSQRHVSWLETGRSQPSKEMVVRLAEAMEVPLRERNHILNAAGFSNMYTENALDAPDMEPVLTILKEMLAHHDPYPAYVLDRFWNIKMQNKAADILFEISGDPELVWQAVGDDGQRNIALVSAHPNGFRNFITNWDEFINAFMQRLKRETLESSDPEMLVFYDKLEQLAGPLPDENYTKPLLPIIPIEIGLGDLSLSLASVISTFGTAQDITANELRIEAFYPTNEQTAKFFKE